MLYWPGTGDSRFLYKMLKQIAVQYIACSLLMSLIQISFSRFQFNNKSNFNNTSTYIPGITPSITTATADLC